MAIYNHLPIALQNAACNAYGRRINKTRYSKDFWRLLSEYEGRADWSYDQLAEFRDARLRKMIDHCYRTVPYYKRLFDDGGINPASIKTLDDLHVLPILDKATVNANPDDFISTAIPKNKMITMHTSGTTGSGFIFKTTQEAICEQWAVWWRYRRALGIEFGTEQATFSGQRVVPVSQTKPPFWRTVKPCHEIYFSIIHESESTLLSYYQFINSSEISWIHGYPSALYLLAFFMNGQGLHFNHIEHVTTGAENLSETQITTMHEAFRAIPHQHYGTAEGVANFSENVWGDKYIDEDFSAVELVPTESQFEVVGSTLTNYAMPLLRWSLHDLVGADTSQDGRRQILSLDGRLENYLVLPNGRKVGRLDHAFKDATTIKEAQIVQHSDYSVEVLYVVGGGQASEGDINSAVSVLREMLDWRIPITFTRVDRIPRTANGKLRFVISEVK